jgi:hypothetical protein
LEGDTLNDPGTVPYQQELEATLVSPVVQPPVDGDLLADAIRNVPNAYLLRL